MKKHPLSTLFLCLLGVVSVHGADLYVDCSSTNMEETGAPAAPYKTLTKAVWKSKHGDTITVAQGTYRESIFLYGKKGEAPLTIKAAKGARPVITGFKPVTGWSKDARGNYTAVVNFQPRSLLINGKFQQLARYPEVGWLSKTQVGEDKNVFTSPLDRDIPVGTECYVWYCNNNLFGQLKVKESPKRGTIILEPNRAYLNKNLDLVYFRNHPDFITKHGQWTWKKLDKKKFQITLKCDTPIDQNVIEAAGQHTPFKFNACNNITISGFDITGSNDAALQFGGCQNIHLENLGLFWNTCGGYFRGCKNLTVENCRITANQHAFTTMGNEYITFRKCDIGYNADDGIRITWKTRNAVIEGCRIHHQLWRGHPDNTQFYRDVDGILIKDCLYFNGFQGIMSEQTKNFNLENNIFAGSAAVLLILAADNVTLTNNTCVLGGYGSIRCAGIGFDFSNNVIHGMQFQKGPHKDRKYVGKNNLFLTHKANTWRDGIDNKWPWTFDEFVQISGEQNSQQQVLPLPGFPAAMAVIDFRNLSEATTDTFQVRGNGKFQLGDTVEICFDGVPRTITAATKDTISVKPALKYPPAHSYIILNWKNQKNMVWKPQFAKKVGSTLSWDDIRLDRCTTVPVPANVQDYIDNFDRLMLW